MAPQQPSQVFSCSKARRAANNNYSKLTQTLYGKLTKLCTEYNAHIYFVAYRNGRFNGFVSEEKGQPWSPPDRDTLVSTSHSLLSIANASKETLYPPPIIKSPGHCRRAQRGSSRKTTSRHSTESAQPKTREEGGLCQGRSA
jgi:hypothetical protein